MQYVLAPESLPSLDKTMFSNAPETANVHPPYAQARGTDNQFVAMLDAYRCNGGLARAQEVVALFKRHREADVAMLANWIVNKQVICFDWQSKMWLPLFQFSRPDMAPQAGLGQVLAELTSAHGPWELANWFAQPNPWLADCTPADTLVSDPCAVLHAARAERFIANG